MTTIKNVFPRLSFSKAKKLALRELGSAKNLTLEDDLPSRIYIYKMQLGTLFITIDNDPFDLGNFFRLHISTHDGQDITRLYNPNTLVEDINAAAERRHSEKNEDFQNRIFEIGLEGCQKILGINTGGVAYGSATKRWD